MNDRRDSGESEQQRSSQSKTTPRSWSSIKSYRQRKRGYECSRSDRASEGISLLKNAIPDTRIILLDLNLPGGIAVIEWIAWLLTRGKKDAVAVASARATY